MTMTKLGLWLIGITTLLYVIKVRFVVVFINQNLSIAITVWNYIFDVAINLRERHSFVWVSLFLICILCLIPPKEYHAGI